MYCTKCGAYHDDGETVCSSCGYFLGGAGTDTTGEPVQDYLIAAILTTFLCFTPLGVIAVYFAVVTREKLKTGDIAGAQESSRRAKKMISWNVGLFTALVIVILAVIGFILFFPESSSHTPIILK